MSALDRARSQLRSGAAKLLPCVRTGGYGVYRGGDRRRRPVLLLSPAEGERLLQELAQDRAPVRTVPARAPGSRPSASAAAAPLARDEEAALHRLAMDMEASAAGLYRGVDWQAPASTGQPRGPGRAEPPAAAARARVRAALGGLAPVLADVAAAHLAGRPVAAVLERQGFPARHARTALRLAAAQLAHAYRGGPDPCAGD